MACDGVSHAIVSHGGILSILLTIDVGSLRHLRKADLETRLVYY